MLTFLNRTGEQLSVLWRDVYENVLNPKPDTVDDARIAAEARERAPVIWLLGMVGTGKSSIIRTLTGSSDAEVGTGYRPCTATARVYEFPSEAPVIRFLDTRGLGEVAYDPAEDLALCESQAHLVLAVVKAVGPVPPAVLEALVQVRRRHPDWPVVVAQTTLHDAYPGKPHPLPYPFLGGMRIGGEALDRSLAAQRAAFARLPGDGSVTFVPIDFTQEGDGLEPEDYGVEALWAALEAASADGVVSMARRSLDMAGGPGAGRALSHIWGYAATAGAIDTLPVAGALAVPVVQGKMLHSLAGILGVTWTRTTLAEFSGCLGAGALAALRHAVRRAATGQAGAGIRHPDRRSRRRGGELRHDIRAGAGRRAVPDGAAGRQCLRRRGGGGRIPPRDGGGDGCREGEPDVFQGWIVQG